MLPPLAPTTATRSAGRGYLADGSTNPYPMAAETDARPRPRGRSESRRLPAERSAAPRAIIGAAVVVVLAVIGVVAWSLSHGTHHTTTPPPASQHPTSPAAATAVALTPAGANSFDALGTDGGNENADDAKYAIDGSTSTAWHTDYYYGTSTFGNLKKGTGLILDMGKQVRLSQVTVQFGSTCCTQVEIEIGNSDTPTPAALSTFTELQSSATAAGVTTFNVTKNATGRYVLIWITNLPPRPGSSGSYESFIYNVTLHGSAASQSG